MIPEHSDLVPLSALIEASCAPMFGKIQSELGLDISGEKIMAFAEQNGRRDDSVQLAVHICEILLAGIGASQNDSTYIHTTTPIREKIAYITQIHKIQSGNLVALHGNFELPLQLNKGLILLAQQFIEQI